MLYETTSAVAPRMAMPSADVTASDVVSPPKFSRYRSVRQGAASKSPPSTASGQAPEHDALVSRSMSRYRSRPKAPDGQIARPPMPQPVPPLPTQPLPKMQSPVSPASPAMVTPTSNLIPLRNRAADAGQLDRNGMPLSQQRPRNVSDTVAPRPVTRAPTYPSAPSAAIANGPPLSMGGQKYHERRRQEEAAMEEARMAELAGAENAKRLAEQKRKDLERLEAELDAATAAAPPASQNQAAGAGKEKFGLFTRKRGATLTKASPPPSLGSGSEPKVPLPKMSNDVPRRMDPSPRPVAPRNDAPVSAVNAGERRVLVRCKQSSINLPVSPDTTPVDLIYSAANVMTQNISPTTAILLESYGQLGLERRVRRYEHIRDIMNSWDRDTQNSLIIQNSETPKHDTDLEVSSVPKKIPPDVTVHMYHSQKPGKWNKRYITLLSTGQIFLAKKPGAKLSDKDVTTLCHMTDFDIYSPTPQEARKHLKPPKKFCHAIKSQQKTVMFLSTENFVHFFSTDDEALSEKWYEAVQTWRSWYLVNKMGEGNAKSRCATDQYGRPIKRPSQPNQSRHAPQISVDENPYTIGSFKPLGILERFNPDDDYDSEEDYRPRQIPFHLRNSVNLSAPSRRESRRYPPNSYRPPPNEPEDTEGDFAPSGLLGRTYSQKLKAMQERNEAEGPFVEGPSLLNHVAAPPQPPTTRDGHQRTLSMRSTNRPRAGTMTQRPEAGGRERTMTLTGQKPLVDLTPKFEEAPQWNKAGKGHGVQAPQGLPLVEIAGSTRNDHVNPVPKLPTVFRRDG